MKSNGAADHEQQAVKPAIAVSAAIPVPAPVPASVLTDDPNQSMAILPDWVEHKAVRDRNSAAAADRYTPIYSADMQPGGVRFVTAGGDNTIKIWSVAPLLSARSESDEKQPKLLAVLNHHTQAVNCVRFNWSVSVH